MLWNISIASDFVYSHEALCDQTRQHIPASGQAPSYPNPRDDKNPNAQVVNIAHRDNSFAEF
jgi:hypothetical protein